MTGAAEFENIDIVISSTSAPHYILDRAKLEPLMKLRGATARCCWSIWPCRATSSRKSISWRMSILYNIDDLQSIAGDYLNSGKRKSRVANRSYVKKPQLCSARPSRNQARRCVRPSKADNRHLPEWLP